MVADGIACEVLLVRGGPLVAEYRAVCPTLVLGGPPPVKSMAETSVQRFIENGLGGLYRTILRFVGRLRLRQRKIRWRRRGLRAVCLNAAMSAHYGLLGEYAHCPVLFYVHELAFGMQFALYGDDFSRLVSGDATFIVPSPCVSRNLIQAHGVAPHRIRTIAETVPDPRESSGMDKAQARRALGIPDDACVIMMAGTADWRKGLDLFVALGRNLADRLPNAHFCWIGGGRTLDVFMRRWQRHYSIPPALAERFHFAGERENAAELLQAADVFTLTSREDPLPLVHIEAAMFEVPIVCFSASGGAPEWIGDGGIVVPFQDISAMADAVVTLAENPALRQQMGKAARALMLKHCLPRVTARQMRDLIDEITGSVLYQAS